MACFLFLSGKVPSPVLHNKVHQIHCLFRTLKHKTTPFDFQLLYKKLLVQFEWLIIIFDFKVVFARLWKLVKDPCGVTFFVKVLQVKITSMVYHFFQLLIFLKTYQSEIYTVVLCEWLTHKTRCNFGSKSSSLNFAEDLNFSRISNSNIFEDGIFIYSSS